MPNTYFKFKQFTIQQEHCAMKVGTDGILLGAWIEVEQAKRVLDIGTGTGLIALMVAQKSSAIIDAVEIEKNAADQAGENFKQSPWKNRLTVFHHSFQEYSKTCNHKYDVIVSNPPFFANSLKTSNKARTLARHSHQLPIGDVFKGVANLLNKTGFFYLIIPSQSLETVQKEGIKNDLFLYEKLLIKSTPTSSFKRVICCFSFSRPLKISRKEFIIGGDEKNQYSNAFINLTKDFYLNL